MIVPETLTIHSPKKELLNIINNRTFKDKILFEKESSFHNIKVVENEIGRFLHYNNTYQAGFINTPYYKGNLPYINYFLLPYFYRREMSSVLLIGLGSGKIVNDLYKIYSEIKHFDVVDIEENIFEIAQKYFNFKPPENSNFYLQDALIYLKTTKKKYDLIIVDVANNDGIDERFISDEYFKSIKSHLKKDGIFISNLCTSPDTQNPKNKFFRKIKNIHSKNFFHIKYYLGNYSDKIYYKTFFNINERVIDITNLIILSSNSELKPDKSKTQKFSELFPNISVKEILQDEI